MAATVRMKIEPKHCMELTLFSAILLLADLVVFVVGVAGLVPVPIC
jgi:hypothetical protein